MQYMVTGADGKEYGPSDVETLKQWVAQNRLAPHSQLRDVLSGQTLAASAVPGLFDGPVSYPRPGNAGSVPYTPPASNARDEGAGVLLNVVWRSVAAVVLFFALHGIGVVFAAYAMVYAVQCQRSGSKYGIVALVIAGVALAAVGIGWALRLSGAGV